MIHGVTSRALRDAVGILIYFTSFCLAANALIKMGVS
jgi:hypothetical protein